jgi:hypothetical protein
MNKFTTTTVGENRAGSFTATLMLAAVIAVMAGAKTAKAWDQQATEDEMNSELVYRPAPGHGAPVLHQVPSGAFARANSHEHGFGSGVAIPQHDFQLEGR